MSYQTDDGLHEGWEAAEFPDGRFSVGPGDGGCRSGFSADLDTDAEPGVLDGRTAVGWRGVCTCGWRGQLWERVTDPVRHNPIARKVFDPVPSVYADVPAHVDDAIYREWRRRAAAVAGRCPGGCGGRAQDRGAPKRGGAAGPRGGQLLG